MRRWSQQFTLNVGLIVIGLLAVVSSGASLVASKYLAHDMAAIAVDGAHNVSDSRTLRLSGLHEIADASTALLTGEARYARAARSWSSAVRAGAARLQTKIADPEGRFLVGRVQATERDYQQAFDEAASSSGGPSVAAVATLGQVFDQALNDLETHMAPAAVGIATARASMRRAQAVLNGVAAGSIVLALILCVMILIALNRSYSEQSSARDTAAQGQTKTTADLNEARVAIQVKDRFLATISHELRNPLAPILTWTQLLRGGTLGKKKADRGLEMIERNVLSLSELINDLVDVSRVVAGKFRLDVGPIDLASDVELQRNIGASKRTVRGHRIDARNPRELPLEWSRNSRRHRRRIRAGKAGGDRNRRIVDVREIGDRQRLIRHHAEQRDAEHNERSRDRFADASFRNVHDAGSFLNTPRLSGLLLAPAARTAIGIANGDFRPRR